MRVPHNVPTYQDNNTTTPHLVVVQRLQLCLIRSVDDQYEMILDKLGCHIILCSYSHTHWQMKIFNNSIPYDESYEVVLYNSVRKYAYLTVWSMIWIFGFLDFWIFGFWINIAKYIPRCHSVGVLSVHEHTWVGRRKRGCD